MKRLFLVGLTILALSFGTSVLAAVPPPPTVSVGNYTIDIGDTITIPVNIANGVDIYGGDVRLQYDSELVEGISVERGTYLQPDYVVREAIYPPPFFARYALTQINPSPPVSGSGTFMFVTFAGLKAGVSPLSLIYVELPDRYGDVVPAVTLNGTLTVNDPSDPTAIRLRRFNAKHSFWSLR